MHKAVFFLDGGGAVAGNFDGIKQRSFGIEIKMTGLIRCQAAKEISELFGTQPEHMAEVTISTLFLTVTEKNGVFIPVKVVIFRGFRRTAYNSIRLFLNMKKSPNYRRLYVF